MSDQQDDSRDLERAGTADHLDQRPGRSRTVRLVRWLSANALALTAGTGVLLFVLASFAGVEIPRNLRIIGLSGALSLALLGRPTGKKVRSMLWNPRPIYLVDLDARHRSGALFRIPSETFRLWSTREGQLDWASPNLVFGKDVDQEGQEATGTWRGTMTDRDLLVALEAIEECRGKLQQRAQRGFRIEMQAFSIIREATESCVGRIVSTFERGTLPDEGEGLDSAVNSALEEFDLDRDLRNVKDDDEPPAGTELDLDLDLDPTTGGGAPQGGQADD